jgi:hypothetical protein
MKELIPITEDMDRDRGKHHLVVINLIHSYGVKRAVEVGVYKGRMMRRVMRSAVGPSLEEWYAVDTWESNEGWYPGCGDQAAWDRVYLGTCKYMPWFPALRVIKSKSVEAATMFQDGHFDMVYLDGDHTTKGVLSDIRAWLPKVKRGGLMAGHDYALGGPLVSELCDVAPAVHEVFGEDFSVDKCSVWHKVV